MFRNRPSSARSLRVHSRAQTLRRAFIALITVAAFSSVLHLSCGTWIAPLYAVEPGPATEPAATSGVLDPQAAAEQRTFFEARVRPLLIHRCGECHSAETGSEHGELVLEHPEGIAQGGSRGPVLDRDHPDQSLLLRSVRYADVDLQMPPEGKLSDAELAVLETWVARGAYLPPAAALPTEPPAGDAATRPPAPAGIDWATARQFWSFRPLIRPPVPEVQEASWSRRALDRFVQARREQERLAANPEADRAAWLRRVTLDLTGLPPTPEQLDAFLTDHEPDAAERVVDRLLASPHFGERWARFWLDLARYTDQTPDWQSPTDRGWLYRDWVVDAMNEGLPYDQFVRRQLAADLDGSADPSDLAALGFLGLSPTYWKELKLAPSVIQQIVADEWDERIDMVTRTFLGLTVSCARCHDHKFDPITMHDYYALAGVFASSQISERFLVTDEQDAVLRAARRELQELEAKLKTLRDQNSAEAEEVARQVERLRAEHPGLEGPYVHGLREASIHVLPEGTDATRLEIREGEAREVPVYRRGNPLNPGESVARRYLRLFAVSDSDHQPPPFQHGSGRRELAEAMLADSAPLVARVIVNRLWDQHFHTGLVRTPSDFGTQGEAASHPELLEHLAAELPHHDWDLKWLHRQIVLSATYRQSSDYRNEAGERDPENRLLWRMNRGRLHLEMWRDGMLSVTGQLDPRLRGPSQPIDAIDNRRRSIYATIAREDLHPMLRMHDFPEASAHSPRREPTITPLQQLFVLNSPWIEQQAACLWERVRVVPEDERLNAVYRLLYSRYPTAREQELARRFLGIVATAEVGVAAEAVKATTEAGLRWQDYLQALLGVNEFHYVD